MKRVLLAALCSLSFSAQAQYLMEEVNTSISRMLEMEKESAIDSVERYVGKLKNEANRVI